MSRSETIKRTTAETDIDLFLEIDGTGKSNIDTGCGFLNHMLTLFASHGKFDLNVKCKGDVDVDYHHSVEDIGISLGKAFAIALGDMRGINRYADIILPMDEALIMCAVDVSGRSWYENDLSFPCEKIGDFDTELINEFFVAFASNARINLHFKQLSGRNSHHIAEGCFKAVARVLNKATSINVEFQNEIPSTKGVL